MWLLYNIKKNKFGQFRDNIVSRLRPRQTYVIVRRGKLDDTFEVAIETDPISRSQAINPRSLPDIRLIQTKSNKVEALVDDKKVEDDYILHDLNIIRPSVNETRFRVRWEYMVIFKDGPEDNDYRDMISEAQTFGFHITRSWSRLVTHVWISDTPQTEISQALLLALMQQKYIITKSWIKDKFLTSQDIKFDINACYETIPRIEWKEFGPLKKPALLYKDNRRLTLFKDMNFIAFDKDQVETLSDLINAGKGSIIYFDLNSREEVNIGANTIFILPPEDHTYHQNGWESLKKTLHERTGSIREIQEVEIGFAIVYCSTEHMCNPVASLSSFNLESLDVDDEYISNIKTEDEGNQYISNSMASTLPYNAGSYDEESNNRSEGLNNRAEGSNHLEEASNHLDEESKIFSEESKKFSKESKNNMMDRPSCQFSQNPMSPFEAMSPMDDDDVNSPPMPSLNNLLDDFDFKAKPLPPPKRKFECEGFTSSSNQALATVSVPSTSTVRSPPVATVRSPPAATVRSPPVTTVCSPSTATVRSPTASVVHSPHASSMMSTSRSPPASDIASTSRSNAASASLSPTTVPAVRSISPTVTLPTTRPTVARSTTPSASTSAVEATDIDGIPANNSNDLSIPRGCYSNVVFAKLVVNPSPPVNRTVHSNEVNYKRFKKVKQFQDLNSLDVVNLVNNSQRVRETRRRPTISHLPTLDEAEGIDPLLAISVPRRTTGGY